MEQVSREKEREREKVWMRDTEWEWEQSRGERKQTKEGVLGGSGNGDIKIIYQEGSLALSTE